VRVCECGQQKWLKRQINKRNVAAADRMEYEQGRGYKFIMYFAPWSRPKRMMPRGGKQQQQPLAM